MHHPKHKRCSEEDNKLLARLGNEGESAQGQTILKAPDPKRKHSILDYHVALCMETAQINAPIQ